jgi:hypothetical protein
MNFDIERMLNSVVSVIALLGVIWLSGKIASVVMKVETIWEFLMKRALSEALIRGVAIQNSPVRVTDEAKRWMSDLIPPNQGVLRQAGAP